MALELMMIGSGIGYFPNILDLVQDATAVQLELSA